MCCVTYIVLFVVTRLLGPALVAYLLWSQRSAARGRTSFCHTRLLPHACALTEPWDAPACCLSMSSMCWHAVRPCRCLQVKTKGARRITFEQFLTALSKLAERKVG